MDSCRANGRFSARGGSVKTNILGPTTNLDTGRTAHAFLKLHRRTTDPDGFERAFAMSASPMPRGAQTLWLRPIRAVDRRCRPSRLSVGLLDRTAALSKRPPLKSRAGLVRLIFDGSRY